MYISWHFSDNTFFISIIPVTEQVCFLLTFSPSVYWQHILTCCQTKWSISYVFFVSGSLMKIPSKIGPSADPQKVHLKRSSRQEGFLSCNSFHMPFKRGFWTWQLFSNSISHCFGENSPCGPLCEMLSSSPKRWEPEHCLSAEYNFCYRNKSRLS